MYPENSFIIETGFLRTHLNESIAFQMRAIICSHHLLVAEFI